MLRLLLCVENRIFRDGLGLSLGRRSEFRIARACGSLKDVPALLAENGPAGRPDVVLADVGAPDATDDIRRIYLQDRTVPIVALGLAESDAEILAYAEAGASAFVTREASVEDLFRTIETAAEGGMHCTPQIAALLRARLTEISVAEGAGSRRAEPEGPGQPAEDPARGALDKLSRRERDILCMLSRAMSNKQIARELELEVSTVKNHVHSILTKLQVPRRTDAAALWAATAGAV